jgi:mannose-6-phosphate isomerase-like protein (cupin superfamily)
MKITILASVGMALLCAAAVAQQSGHSGRPMQMKSEGDAVMKGFVGNIENLTDDNSNFRRVLYTGKNLQLVLMALKPGEEIGEEVHTGTDQFFRIEKGEGEVRINGEPTKIKDGDAVLVPAGARHNIVNTGGEPLRLYTLYAPPQHRDGTVQATKVEAERAKEHFDGKTTE